MAAFAVKRKYMSIMIQIDHDRRRVVGVASGTLEDRDLFAYQQEAGRFPDYDEIFDGTAVEHLQDVNPACLKKLADVAAAADRAGRAAKLVIIASQDVHFGLGRMYGSLRECAPHATKKSAVFHTREEAEQWLAAKEE